MSSEVRNTPIGTLKFTYLTEKDTEYDKNGIYHCTLKLKKLEAEPEIAAIQDVIKKTVADAHRQKKDLTLVKRAPLPYKTDPEDGSILIKFKSKFKPTIYDGNRQEISPDVSIYKGTTARIKYKLSGYHQSIGIGCVLHLLAVQVAKLVDNNQNKECPFEEIKTVEPIAASGRPLEKMVL